jgi:hypothetical protein
MNRHSAHTCIQETSKGWGFFFKADLQFLFNIIFVTFVTIKKLEKWCQICQHTQNETIETDFMD